MRIQGDSMEPYIHDGSVVYVNHDPLRAGDVGIFCVDGDMLCKQYYRDPLGVVYLFSLNRRRADADVILPPSSVPQPHLLRSGDAPRLAYTGIKKTQRKTIGFPLGTFFPLSQNKAAVAGQHLPGDEVRLVRGQKRHGVGDVLRRSQAAHGSLLRQLGQYLSGQGVQHIRADDARRHAVHPDVGGGQLCRQRPGQADEGRLGAGVGDLAAGAPQSPDGGGVDDASLVVVQHGGEAPPEWRGRRRLR